LYRVVIFPLQRADALFAPALRAHASRTCASFCRACILAALARQAQCPLDRGALTTGALVPNRMVAAYLAELPVRCAHAAAAVGDAAPEDGEAECAWTGALEALSEHLRSECGAETVPCPNAAAGCDTEFRRRDARTHAAVCVHEPVTCTVVGCAARLTRGALFAHMRDAAQTHVALLQAAVAAAEHRADDAERRAAAPQRAAQCSSCDASLARAAAAAAAPVAFRVAPLRFYHPYGRQLGEGLSAGNLPGGVSAGGGAPVPSAGNHGGDAILQLLHRRSALRRPPAHGLPFPHPWQRLDQS
jgi:hypothetical protein